MQQKTKQHIGYILLALFAVAGIVGILLAPPIVQSASYHNFSDAATLLGIPNCWNVLSNLPFLLVGVAGVYSINSLEIVREARISYLLFFVGIALVAVGSGYYHWHPSDESLVWDRLPMTIAFMALLSIIVSEFIHARIGRLLLLPSILVGLFSIVYWMLYNDLRLYALVQFYPLLAMPLMLLCFSSRYTLSIGYWLLFLAYLLAKVFEHFDAQVHGVVGVISGHSLKHLFAGVGLAILLYTYNKRNENTASRP